MNPLPARLTQACRPHLGWFVVLAALGLTCIGIAAIGTVPTRPGTTDYALRQTQWLIIGLMAMFVCLIPHPKTIAQLAYPLMLAALVLLMILIIPGMPQSIVPREKGNRAWLNLQFVTVQPSELAKLAAVLSLAYYLRHRSSYRTLRGLLVPFGIMFVPVGLILMEPDLGTAILFPPAVFAMLVAAGARMRHMITLAGLAVAALVINVAVIWFLPDAMQLMAPYQVNRVRAMIDRATGGTQYIHREGFQQDKAMTLIGSGGWRGNGYERAQTLIRFNALPEAHNDTIFAVVICRWGWLGGLLVLGLYGLLLGTMLLVAGSSKDPLVRLTMVGITAIWAAQVTVNLGMTMGLLPVIGITLPFVSYGGSSLVSGFVMVGIIVNFAGQHPAIISWPSFEYDHAEMAR